MQLTGFVEGTDKTQVFYTAQGTGTPLVFSYGVTCGMYHFKYQVKYFKDQYQIIQYDYRGHGNSAMPPRFENLTIEECAYDLKAVLDKLEISKIILVGHSMGVAVNLKFCELFPEMVEAQVMLCGGIKNPFKMMFYTDLTTVLFEGLKYAYLKSPELVKSAWKNTPNSWNHTLVSLLGYNKLLSQKHDIQLYVDSVKNNPLETLLYFLQDYSKFDGKKICESLSHPVLLFGGQYDLITPLAHIKTVHKFIKNSELFVVPQGSHVSQWDLPDVVNLRMEKFLNSLQLF